MSEFLRVLIEWSQGRLQNKMKFNRDIFKIPLFKVCRQILKKLYSDCRVQRSFGFLISCVKRPETIL